jgi:hypothetical protein
MLTPKFLMVAIVASIYGFETTFPSIFKLIPYVVRGPQIINAEIN